MIISLDCETKGLNGPLIEACIYKSKRIQYICKNKTQIWNVLTKLAKKESQRSHNLYVYAHNMKFDFYKIIDWTKPGITITNEMPFMAQYTIPHNKSTRHNKHATIHFLDTWALYRRNLTQAAQLIGHKKTETPKNLKNPNRRGNTLNLKERQYMINDAKICYHLVQRIKQELKTHNTKVRNIITIGQIAINVFLNHAKKENTPIFKSKIHNQIHPSKYAKDIHKAYRYGRIQVKRTTTTTDTHEVDINNLYSYSAMTNPFPNLLTERKICYPLQTLSIAGLVQLLRQYPIGVTKAVMLTPTNSLPYGFLPIKINNQIIYPNQPNKYLIGQWTNTEITHAIQLGYQIITCEYVITYKPLPKNPFQTYFQTIYHRRQHNQFSNYFWKQIANYTIGKFAQTKKTRQYKLDDINKATHYYQQGWEFSKSHKTNYLYTKVTTHKQTKYYNPIIPTMINAYAKIYHYNYLTKIPYEDFVYCDTDNIIFINANNIKKFPIGNRIGQFKLSQTNTSYKSWNKKTYRIGNELRTSGITKTTNPHTQKQRLHEFNQGSIQYQRMIGIQHGQPLTKAGTFQTINVNLHNSMQTGILKDTQHDNNNIILATNDTFNILHIIKEINKHKCTQQ